MRPVLRKVQTSEKVEIRGSVLEGSTNFRRTEDLGFRFSQKCQLQAKREIEVQF